MSVSEMVIERRDENILRAIERITSVYSLAWEIKRDIKEVPGTLGFDWIKEKIDRELKEVLRVLNFIHSSLSTHITGHFVSCFYLGVEWHLTLSYIYNLNSWLHQST